MGKVLIIKGADFSTYKIDKIDIGVEAPVVSVSVTGSVTISSPYTVYYTTNGANPTKNSTKYTGTFTVSKGATVKAIAYLGENYSKVVSVYYDGTLQAPSITVSKQGLVTITSQYTVYYTINGNTPTTTSMVYTAPFSVEDGTTIKAIAYSSGVKSSVTTVIADVPQTAFMMNKWINGETGEVLAKEGYCLSGFYEVKPSTSYHINAAAISFTEEERVRYCTVEFAADKTTVVDQWNHTPNERDFTTTSTTKYIRTVFKMNVAGQYISEKSNNEKIIEYIID